MRVARVSLLGLALTALLGCAIPAQRPYVFEPVSEGETEPYYVLGSPYGSVSAPCAILTTNLTPAVIAGTPCLRVYVHYENTSPEPHLVDPSRAIRLEIVAEGPRSPPLEPISPTDLLDEISRAKTGLLVLQAMLGAMEAVTVRPTAISGPSGTWKLDDTDRKVRGVLDRTAAAMAITDISGDIVAHAVNTHLLRRHTVFPDRAVGGFVYFPIPPGLGAKTRTASTTALTRALSSFQFYLTVETPCGSQHVRFAAVEGE
jgi:hypothetical protein